MKLIVAVIDPERLEAVQQAATDPTATLLAVSEVLDPGRPRDAVYRGVRLVHPSRRLRVELAVANEACVDALVEAIRAAGSEGGRPFRPAGDVVVLPLDRWERIAVVPPRPRPQMVRASGK